MARESLPFGMFDVAYTDREARRARRMESIYHVGQDRIWDGRDVLADLIARHGRPKLAERERSALSQIFSVIMWGELAAWKISAQLTDVIVPLEAKLAASSQVHDEARHFYVMHDYLEALGHKPPVLDYWSKRVLAMTLKTKSLAKKLLGMQLTIETIALTIFQRVRELEVEPVLTELLPYYERDEARHVGLGIQLLPALVSEMSYAERVDFAVFHLDLYGSAVMSLKSLEPALQSIGVDPVARLFQVRAIRLRCRELGITRSDVQDRQIRLHLSGPLPKELVAAKLPELVHLQLDGAVLVLFVRTSLNQDAALNFLCRLLGLDLGFLGRGY